MSPVGALNNGIELLADETDPDMREQCLELLADSARATANKLKFFRLAFGAGGGFADEVDTREAEAAIEGLFGDGKVELGWVVEDEKLPKGATVLLNLVPSRRRCAGAGRAARRRRRDGTRRHRHRRPRRRAADPPRSRRCARPRDGRQGTIEPRAAGAWLAHQLGRRRRRLAPPVRPVERVPDDRRDPSDTGITAR